MQVDLFYLLVVEYLLIEIWVILETLIGLLCIDSLFIWNRAWIVLVTERRLALCEEKLKKIYGPNMERVTKLRVSWMTEPISQLVLNWPYWLKVNEIGSNVIMQFYIVQM